MHGSERSFSQSSRSGPWSLRLFHFGDSNGAVKCLVARNHVTTVALERVTGCSIKDHCVRRRQKDLTSWKVTLRLPRHSHCKRGPIAQQRIPDGESVSWILIDQSDEAMFTVLRLQICEVNFLISGEALSRGATDSKHGHLRGDRPTLIGKGRLPLRNTGGTQS